MNRYGKLPLSFEENRGQADQKIKFLARGIGYTLSLAPNEAVLKLRGGAPGFRIAPPAPKYSILRIRLDGANANARASGIGALPGKSNYFIGSDRTRWLTGLANFRGVEFADIYPGVNLKYRGTEGRLEYDFTVAPGADPRRIRLSIDGARKLVIDSRGDLVIETSNGQVVQKAPVIYQTASGNRRTIPGRYLMRGAQSIGFAIAAYDRKRPLIIDPLVSYASYLGGTQIDFGAAIAVDSAGEAIVTGYTDSADFPITSGAFQPSLFEAPGGANDVFISKINAAGTALIYSTYAGGGNEDEGTAVSVDAAGNAYVAGYTMSADFPVTVGAFQTNFAGTQSAFVTALDQNGGLIYSTFLNGSATSSAAGIATDARGSAFATGVTTSADFPVTAGAYQTSFVPMRGQDRAAFVTKLNPTGTALEYSTFLGPPNYLAGNAIGLDDAGNAYVAGTMYAAGNAGGSSCPASNSDCGFALRLDASGGQVDFSTLLNFRDGGYTEPHSIAVDSVREAHIVGNFGISGEHFGFLENLDSHGGVLNSVNLSNLLSPNAIALGSSGNIFVAGTVFGNGLATTPGSFQSNDPGNVNAFLNEYDPTGTVTLYSTYLGGGDQDEAFGVAVDPRDNAYLTGYAQSSDFPATSDALQPNHGGGVSRAGTLDAFVARIVPLPALSPIPTATATSSPTPAPTASTTVTLTATPTAVRTPLPTRVPIPSNTPTWVPTLATTSTPIIIPTATPVVTATATGTPTSTPAPWQIRSIGAAPGAINFHRLKIGITMGPKFVTISNRRGSRAPITIDNFVLAAGADFVIQTARSTCHERITLLPGRGCKLAVTFTPTARGLRRDTLIIHAGAAGKTIRLLGIGN